jgi:hypothetical protein
MFKKHEEFTNVNCLPKFPRGEENFSFIFIILFILEKWEHFGLLRISFFKPFAWAPCKSTRSSSKTQRMICSFQVLRLELGKNTIWIHLLPPYALKIQKSPTWVLELEESFAHSSSRTYTGENTICTHIPPSKLPENQRIPHLSFRTREMFCLFQILELEPDENTICTNLFPPKAYSALWKRKNPHSNSIIQTRGYF